MAEIQDNKNYSSPNTFIIGAAKSGTTTLAHLLSMHPDVYVGAKKEPEFFSFDENFTKGLTWYRQNYEGAKEGQTIIDASTGYTRYPQYPLAAQRIHAFNPNAKLIYIMRHPVERAYSHFIHRYSKELHPNEPFRETFSEFVSHDPMCLDSSDYQLQLEQYAKYFDMNSILLLFTDDLNTRPSATMKTVCDFLSLTYDESYFTYEKKNISVDFLHSRKRNAITDQLKKLPGYHWFKQLIPKQLKDVLINSLIKSSKKIDQSYTPQKLTQAERQKLLSEFEMSTKWVEKLTHSDLTAWTK